MPYIIRDSAGRGLARLLPEPGRYLGAVARRLLPLSTRRRLARSTVWPPRGLVRFGNLRRRTPISKVWGTDRGLPVDRHYIHQFLAAHANDIRGRVLEIGDNTYTCVFGGDRVTRSDVLHVAEHKPQVTIIGDLANGDHIPSSTFDCVILTQTLQAIFDVPAALRTVYRILTPGGIVLVTVPGISKISRYDMDRWGYYWSFTTRSVQRLLEAVFPAPNVQVEAHGNVLTAVSFLHGLAAEELRAEELDYRDPDYELVIGARAVKPEAAA